MNNEITKIIELIGGKDNISSVTHCVTRLRFALKDQELAKQNLKEIEDLPGVKGCFAAGGQFQIIIGNEVPEYYQELVKQAGISASSKEDVKEDAKQNLTWIQRAVGVLAEVFIPIVPAIVAGGLLLGFRNLLEMPLENLLAGQSLMEYSQFWTGLHDFLWLVCEAVFAYLPVHVVWSTYKKMGGTDVLGIVLGITLVSPQLLNAYSVASTPVDQIPVWDFGYFQIEKIGYQAQVVPAFLVGLMGGWLEVKLTKFVHKSVRLIVVPVVILLVMPLIAHVVIGPIGWAIGAGIANIIIWLFESFSLLAGAVFGFFYAPLVITGLHHLTIPIDVQLLATNGETFIAPIVSLSNIAQGAAVVGTIVLIKTTKHKELAVPSVISAWLGVTEPAMYGVNLKYFSPFIAGCIGTACAGAYVMLTDVTHSVLGIAGIPSIISVTPGDLGNYLIAMGIAILVPILLTVVFMKGKILTNE